VFKVLLIFLFTNFYRVPFFYQMSRFLGGKIKTSHFFFKYYGDPSLESLILWPPRTLTFPPGTPCIQHNKGTVFIYRIVPVYYFFLPQGSRLMLCLAPVSCSFKWAIRSWFWSHRIDVVWVHLVMLCLIWVIHYLVCLYYYILYSTAISDKTLIMLSKFFHFGLFFLHYLLTICPISCNGYGLDGLWVGSSSPGRVKNFLFSTSSRPALGPTQPPMQRVLGALSPGVKQPVREADHSPQLVTRSRKCGSIHSCPHTPSWRSA
jgi:hypothetical protein